MARKFYNKLFKEFALADLSKYREGKVGLRWRTEAEVEMGKGHLSCGGLHCTRPAETSSSVSSEDSSLHSYEVLTHMSSQGYCQLVLTVLFV